MRTLLKSKMVYMLHYSFVRFSHLLPLATVSLGSVSDHHAQ
ncbi:hypothetical protein PMI35_05504 [Pseudomonas sp. GM78]|nr:hypothetical protein PMI35_05504 [Pseudomonas sp. GM78]